MKDNQNSFVNYVNSFAFYPTNLKQTLMAMSSSQSAKPQVEKLFTDQKAKDKGKEDMLINDDQKYQVKKKRVLVSFSVEQSYQTKSVVQLFESLLKF